MKIATWNVNSIKARLDHAMKWLGDEKPDILMMQELKGLEFPADAFTSAGYQVNFVPQKTYNGVAIISCQPPAVIMIAANDVMEERRRKQSGVRPAKTPKKPEDNGVAEVDLHLHELVEDESHWSPEERLSYQLAYFEQALEAAIRDGKRKLIVIHGVGEGVLREEVRRTLQYYQGVQFHDADMRRYGVGATEVLIHRHR